MAVFGGFDLYRDKVQGNKLGHLLVGVRNRTHMLAAQSLGVKKIQENGLIRSSAVSWPLGQIVQPAEYTAPSVPAFTEVAPPPGGVRASSRGRPGIPAPWPEMIWALSGPKVILLEGNIIIARGKKQRTVFHFKNGSGRGLPTLCIRCGVVKPQWSRRSPWRCPPPCRVTLPRSRDLASPSPRRPMTTVS